MRTITGWCLIAIAVVFIPTPLPLGAVLFTAGLAVLGPRDPALRWGRDLVLHGLRRAERGGPRPLRRAARRLRGACLGLRASLRTSRRSAASSSPSTQ